MDERLNKIYKGTTRQIYLELETSAHGLSKEEALKRLETYGHNEIAKKEKNNVLKIFFKNFVSMLAILLWVAGTIAIISCFIASESPSSIGVLKDPGMLYLGLAIYLVNIINGVFSFVQQFKANKSTEALSKMLPSFARVVRDGEEIQIESKDLVPGDVVVLQEGDKISADARIINCNDFTCNQSTLDGEATPARKQFEALKDDPESSIRAKNVVYAGTSVSTGTARCVVFATGMNTEFGKIASLTQQIDDKKSPLELEVEKMTKSIAMIALSIGAVVLVLGILINGFANSQFNSPTLYLNQFVTALGMVVAFIPEGLSPTVSLSLAKAVQRLSKEGALIKNLSSAETLGSTSVICSDKTGTLTKNEMTVKHLYLINREFEVTGEGYDVKGEILNDSGRRVTAMDSLDLKLLLMCGALCSNAKIVLDENKRFKVLGDPTEACLGVVSEKGLLNAQNQLRITPRIRELTFDSTRKMMTTIHQLEEQIEGTQRVSFTKGSPKEVLDKCNYIFENGKARPITEEDRKKVMKHNDDYAKNGLRVLGMAFRLLKKDDKLPLALSAYTPEIIETDMCFLGLEAMQDPPREGVKEAIAECHKAGIKVIMITGDYSLTALAIAKRIGIVKDKDSRVISGPELNNIDDETLKEYLKGEIIFARMAPDQKYRIVSLLQELGEIVAVTGDGVNDAPALKKANIGIAMGITGTDVAKEAADMILTDDNFASIVKAVKEGRAIFDNIKKFITYIFNSNIPEAIPFLLPLLTINAIPPMLTILEVLLIDIGTDMLPALALGSEKPGDNIMARPPRKLNEHLITKKLYGKALYYGLQTSILCLAAYFIFLGFYALDNNLPFTLYSQTNNEAVWMSSTTVVLASIIFCQIGIVYNCRSDETSIFKLGITSNKEVLYGIVAEIALLMIVTFVPFINTEVFETNQILDWKIWLVILTFPFIVIVIDETRKYFIRRRKTK